jgi:Arc/MetJ-type ribon-helix-helix transcriptional regulator
MTIQITVRLPDELVAFVDAEVARGSATSRADAVARALARERRRRRALQDVAILQAENAAPAAVDDEMDDLARYTAAHPVALDD